ncbi:sarcolemmal membrane-associated protein-like [Varroa jacobsoni]|uniref:FHA domain-containing protein n=1 Tax=Varroa destructor TaxID=109461 RepID=A0A7M7MEL0_VARDE|nr:sarcolemmal membrane-associated protein-like [Varroa destructor]XP_022705724.1 sarcolemmal membrane-associated protein-like [Varroa jacobsoni]
MARDSLDMSGSDSESESLLDSIPDGSVRLSSAFNGPTAHLMWRPNSHKFDDRIVPLSEPAKVGRSVAKFKPAAHNAIFDCKVLSRNHALLWYEDGRFLIQDTQSSNGTFVNNDRLSKGAEESSPREIFSGDILQFGVDVIENSKKVTHGCVIALARLFHPDGSEARPLPNATSDAFSSLTCGQRQSLVQVVMDAIQREAALRDKVQSLQLVIEQLMRAAEQSWEAMIDEERLLNKIESLETKLAAIGENNQTVEINKLVQAKETYEGVAKDSLSSILQEKLMTLRKCDELQYLQKITNEELTQLQTSNEALKGQLAEMADKCDAMKQQSESLLETHVREKKELESKIAQHHEELMKLTDNIAVLQAELAAQKQANKPKVESPVSEKGLTIEDAASEAEDKISLDSFQGETKNSKEIVRLEETLQQLKAKLAKVETEKADLQTELGDQKNLIEATRADLGCKIELQVQLDMFKRENAQLELEVAKYKEQTKQLDALAKENAELKKQQEQIWDLRTAGHQEPPGLQKPKPKMTNVDVQVSAASTTFAPPSVAPPGAVDTELAKELRNLQIKLSTLKQSYARCLEEKVEMRKEFDEMAKEYGGVARQLNTVCRSAVVPLVILCVAVVAVTQPFYSIFGSSKS